MWACWELVSKGGWRGLQEGSGKEGDINRQLSERDKASESECPMTIVGWLP